MLALLGIGVVVIGFAARLNPRFVIAVAAGLSTARIIAGHAGSD
jgi:uncharacterized membrane protein